VLIAVVPFATLVAVVLIVVGCLLCTLGMGCHSVSEVVSAGSNDISVIPNNRSFKDIDQFTAS
jgi:hypothetical protein